MALCGGHHARELGDRAGVLQREPDVVEAVQQAVLAEGVDLEFHAAAVGAAGLIALLITPFVQWRTMNRIEEITAEAEIGKIYRGKVVTIKEFGCFVEFLPGKDGLVHISELANFRVKQTEDIVKMGDEIWVKCLGVDEKGRVRLSRKAAMAERDKEMWHGLQA